MIYKNIMFLLFLSFFIVSCNKSFDKEKYVGEIMDKYDKPLYKFHQLDIDCNKQDSLYLSIFNKDQEARNNGLDYEPVDRLNLKIFVSVVEKCGFPYDEDFGDFRSYFGIFVVLQHNDAELIAYYYEDFKKLVENKKLPMDFLALLEDRFLLLNNKPQLYGTQIKDGKLYKIVKPLELKKRRESMGFKESIEDYLFRYGLDYNDEVKRMTMENTEK